jgi:hypothetical protein
MLVFLCRRLAQKTQLVFVTLKVLLDLPSPKDTEVEIGLGLRTSTPIYMQRRMRTDHIMMGERVRGEQ